MLALGVVLIIGAMFIVGKEPTAHNGNAQTTAAAATAAAATASILKPAAFNPQPVIDEVVVTAERIEPDQVGFEAPKPQVGIVAPKAPKKFWSQS